MTIKEAKELYKNHKMVQHKEEGRVSGYISCFDDEETGAYLKKTHTFIPLENLQVFNIHDYAKNI